MRLGSPGRRKGDRIAEDVGDPKHVRIYIGEHYIGFTPIDDADRFYLVVVSFNREDYADATFRQEIANFRDQIRDVMGWR
jgi:hypothetical protein